MTSAVMKSRLKRVDEIDEGVEWDARLDQFNADRRYLSTHRRSLLKRYPDQWIAVHEQKVVAHHHDKDKFRTLLSQSGAPISWTATEFVSKRRRILLL